MAKLWKSARTSPIGPSRSVASVPVGAGGWSARSCGDIVSTVALPCDTHVPRTLHFHEIVNALNLADAAETRVNVVLVTPDGATVRFR